MNLSNDTYLISGGRQKSASDVRGWLSAILASLRRLGASWLESRARERDIQALYRFSDRELWDGGLSRSDIWAIERGTYHRE